MAEPSPNVLDRERQFRTTLLDQILGGPGRYPDRAGSFEANREFWMGPQCAILEWLLAWLRRYRGIAPADLSRSWRSAPLPPTSAATWRPRTGCAGSAATSIRQSSSEACARFCPGWE